MVSSNACSSKKIRHCYVITKYRFENIEMNYLLGSLRRLKIVQCQNLFEIRLAQQDIRLLSLTRHERMNLVPTHYQIGIQYRC